jgi:hypothetical protein
MLQQTSCDNFREGAACMAELAPQSAELVSGVTNSLTSGRALAAERRVR